MYPALSIKSLTCKILIVLERERERWKWACHWWDSFCYCTFTFIFLYCLFQDVEGRKNFAVNELYIFSESIPPNTSFYLSFLGENIPYSASISTLRYCSEGMCKFYALWHLVLIQCHSFTATLFNLCFTFT